jgi:hypothetical protein
LQADAGLSSYHLNSHYEAGEKPTEHVPLKDYVSVKPQPTKREPKKKVKKEYKKVEKINVSPRDSTEPQEEAMLPQGRVQTKEALEEIFRDETRVVFNHDSDLIDIIDEEGKTATVERKSAEGMTFLASQAYSAFTDRFSGVGTKIWNNKGSIAIVVLSLYALFATCAAAVPLVKTNNHDVPIVGNRRVFDFTTFFNQGKGKNKGGRYANRKKGGAYNKVKGMSGDKIYVKKYDDNDIVHTGTRRYPPMEEERPNSWADEQDDFDDDFYSRSISNIRNSKYYTQSARMGEDYKVRNVAEKKDLQLAKLIQMSRDPLHADEKEMEQFVKEAHYEISKSLTTQGWDINRYTSVYKFSVNGVHACNAVLVGNNMIVTLHVLSADLNAKYTASNGAQILVLEGNNIKVLNRDLAFFRVSGVASNIKVRNLKPMEKAGIVSIISYPSEQDDLPTIYQGFASSQGWCASENYSGMCTAPVMNSTGSIVGFWTHGNVKKGFGRFCPVTSELVEQLGTTSIPLTGLDFLSTPLF